MTNTPEAVAWLIGLFGFLGVVATILSIATSAKKLWGRVPPIEKELQARDALLRSEMQIGDQRLHQRIDEVKAAIEEGNQTNINNYHRMHLDIIERLNDTKGQILSEGRIRGHEVHDRMNKIETGLAELRGKISSTADL